jgi:hypothetical protein
VHVAVQQPPPYVAGAVLGETLWSVRVPDIGEMRHRDLETLEVQRYRFVMNLEKAGFHVATLPLRTCLTLPAKRFVVVANHQTQLAIQLLDTAQGHREITHSNIT